MKTFKDFILEMAIPSPEIKEKTFFHGTSKGIDVASAIAKDGIVPAETTKSKSYFTPVEGMSYATPHIGYAQIYALGANCAGNVFPLTKKQPDNHGYVFAFSGKKLKDIQPDEDEVGELFYNNKHPPWMDKLIYKHVSSGVISKAKSGEYMYFARLGKTIIPRMTDEQKLELITKHKMHVANKGTIIPDRVYRINRDKSPLLKKDGSNFFDHAEELNIDDLKQGIVTKRRKRKPLPISD